MKHNVKICLAATAAMLMSGMGTAVAGGAGAGAASKAQATVHVIAQADFPIDGQHAAFFVARNQGFFAKQHLNVTVLPGVVTSTGLTNVISGKVTFAETTLALLPAAIKGGAKVKAVMEFIQVSPMAACSVATHHKLTSPKSLQGLTVAQAPGSTFAVFLPVLLKHNNIPKTSVHTETIAASVAVNELLSGQVDVSSCFLNTSYWVSSSEAAKRGMKLSVLPFSKFGVSPLTYVIVARDSTKPDVIRRFVKAMVGAEDYMRGHVSTAADDVLNTAPTLTPSIVKHQVQATVNEGNVKQFKTHGYGWFTAAMVKSSLKIFAEGAIPDSTSVPASQLYTNKYLPGK